MTMPARNPFAEYTQNKILSASPAEVTLMLYEGAIKFCNIAIIAIENGETEKAHVNIKKTQRIIEEFRNTLDHKYEVAKEFDKIYIYLLQRLLDANMTKDKAILEEVNMHLRSVRDTWKEVMKRCNQA
ncbi:MAG: flagellar export chaperone FliS [Lachnospiraceae bacterium]|nr:flagellar export chaperone FliS [Lachnospiraceae bacterium]